MVDNWSAEYFEAVVRKYVLRNKIPKSFEDEMVARKGTVIKSDQFLGIIEKLMNNDDEMYAIYQRVNKCTAPIFFQNFDEIHDAKIFLLNSNDYGPFQLQVPISNGF
ncbi:unnamed protein product [Caenorhabditis angaria]|uniref:Uncharacterized protein n=1 Tax=Caenorhabditis angaria TaxID=860376 RepID=A0A9P1IA21_9PELO|nr:unnamed protein product [Caenorhabditis angaria]